MKYNPDEMVITIDGEEQTPFNTEDDPEGWRKLQGQTMRMEFEDGTIIEFEAYNIRTVDGGSDD